MVILDLNMPILDGWGACTKILQIFDSRSKILNTQFISKDVNFVNTLKPLIFGVTASDITNEMIKEAKECGFEYLYERYTAKIVQNEIMTAL